MTSPSIETISKTARVSELISNPVAKAVLYEEGQKLTYAQKMSARDNISAASSADVEMLKKRADVGGTTKTLKDGFHDWSLGAIKSAVIREHEKIAFGSEPYYSHCNIECEPGDKYFFTFRISNASQLFAVGTDDEDTVVYYEPQMPEPGSFTDYEINIPSGVKKLYLCSQTAAEPDSVLFRVKKYIPRMLASIEDIPDVLVDAYHTASATVEHGSEEGVWISLTGKNTPVVVRCDSSDVITQYFVNYLDENDEIKVKVCKPGCWYYFPTLRDSTYQVQARAAYYVTEDGVAVGGDVVVQYADASEIPVRFQHLGVGSVDSIQIVDGAIKEEKLSAELAEKIAEKLSRSDAETLVSETLEEALSDDLPDYVQANVDSVCDQLETIQDAETTSVVWMTDLHAMAFSDNMNNTILPMKRAVNALREIDTTHGLDYYVLGGDYLWNSANSTTKARAVRAYRILQEMFYPVRDKVFACKGNHDDNSIASGTQGLGVVVYPDEEYRYLGKQYERSGAVMDTGFHNRFYGYYDIPSKKIRLIFVNTVDIPYLTKDDDLVYKGQGTVSISEEQNHFVQEALKFDEPGWAVMFFSHHGLTESNVVSAYCRQLWGVIQAYLRKTKFTQEYSTIWGSYTVDVDYTENASNEVIACVCGHNHADRSAVVDDILIVSTGCACPSQPTEIDGENVNPTYETQTETIFDIYTVDRSKGKLFATRYGLGKSREFNYNTMSGTPGEVR